MNTLKEIHNQWIVTSNKVEQLPDSFKGLDEEINKIVAKLVYKKIEDTHENRKLVANEIQILINKTQEEFSKLKKSMNTLRKKIEVQRL